jgi:hypothetical protein
MTRRSIMILAVLAFVVSTVTVQAADRRYDGKPRFHAGMPRRYVIWEQGGVFRLRTTTARVLNRFHGVILAVDGTFTEVRVVRLDKGDYAKLSRNARMIFFSFTTVRGVDGLNFRTDAPQVGFRLKINGREAAPRAEVFLGRHGRHPLRNPFVLFLKEAERDDDSIDLPELEPGQDTRDVLEVVPEDSLEEESRDSD